MRLLRDQAARHGGVLSGVPAFHSRFPVRHLRAHSSVVLAPLPGVVGARLRRTLPFC